MNIIHVYLFIASYCNLNLGKFEPSAWLSQATYEVFVFSVGVFGAKLLK